jgi:hypothetical protein
MELNTQPEACMIVGSQMLPAAWHAVRPQLEQLMEEHSYGETSTSDVLLALESKRSQLWLATNSDDVIIAWAITRVANYPQKRRLIIDYLGGKDMHNWVHYSKFMEDFAASHGCTEIEAWCRKGFTRTLQKHGFHEGYSIMLKPVMRNLQ